MIPATEEMTNFTFKMDKKTRERYSALCDALGFSMSAATLAKQRIEDVKKGSVVEHNIIEA